MNKTFYFQKNIGGFWFESWFSFDLRVIALTFDLSGLKTSSSYDYEFVLRFLPINIGFYLSKRI